MAGNLVWSRDYNLWERSTFWQVLGSSIAQKCKLAPVIYVHQHIFRTRKGNSRDIIVMIESLPNSDNNYETKITLNVFVSVFFLSRNKLLKRKIIFTGTKVPRIWKISCSPTHLFIWDCKIRQLKLYFEFKRQNSSLVFVDRLEKNGHNDTCKN